MRKYPLIFLFNSFVNVIKQHPPLKLSERKAQTILGIYRVNEFLNNFKKGLTNFLKVIICSQCCSAQNANGEISQQQEEMILNF